MVDTVYFDILILDDHIVSYLMDSVNTQFT